MAAASVPSRPVSDRFDDLFRAIALGDAEAVAVVLASAPAAASSRGPDGVSAILRARYLGHHDIVALIEEAGPDLDVFDAAALGRVDHLDVLLSIDPTLAVAWSPDGFTPISLAAFFAQPAAVRILLDAGGDAVADEPARNPMMVTALHAAVAGRSLEAVELVLSAGVDVNRPQQGGVTPLHEAVRNGDAEIEAMLLARGADPTRRDDQGRTPDDLRTSSP
jgi:uncharacterized protein